MSAVEFLGENGVHHPKANFKCTATNKEFFIASWKSKIVNGKTAYYVSGPGWNLLKNPENDALLEKIEPGEINMTSVKTDTASR